MPASPAKDGIALTAKESALLAAIMKNAVADPIVNWDGVVTEVGYSNEKTAREMYRLLKKKLGLTRGTTKDPPSPNGVTKQSPKTATPKKAKQKTSTTPESPLKRKFQEIEIPKTASQTEFKDKLKQVLQESQEEEVPVPTRIEKEEKDAELGVFGLPEDLV